MSSDDHAAGFAAIAAEVAADPTAAITRLAGLRGAVGPMLDERLEAHPDTARRLLAVLGGSTGLADHLARHPEAWRHADPPSGVDLGAGAHDGPAARAALLKAVGADPGSDTPRATSRGAEAYDALRVAYRNALLPIAAADLADGVDVTVIAAALSDLAAATLDAALAIGRAELPSDAPPVRLAVVGMGKCGGRELNYVSDVDVIFVCEPADADSDRGPALATGGRLAAAMMRACGEPSREGVIWPVDAALRPEGKAGPLVRTLASHLAYYERWARGWEFQALLKARAVAGDRELGQAFVDHMAPLVWDAAGREGFVADTQAMRARVLDTVPASVADRQLKLGAGGLRDVEFAVQLLQLVHGRTDATLRSGNTLEALSALVAGGYVGRPDGEELVDAYRFLRTLEHRVQLARLRRTHIVPDDPEELERLGRAMGFRKSPAGELVAEWRAHAREVRRLHEKLFYRPLLAAVARLPGDDTRLTADAARQRLKALGYADPAGAWRHLEALTAGDSRYGAIQRTLLPVLLGWFADGPDPDAGLLGFRNVSDALRPTHWYLRLLRDDAVAAERLAQLLSSSRYVADLLAYAPELVTLLAEDADLTPRPRADIEADMRAAAYGQEDLFAADEPRATEIEAALAAVRKVRAQELFRTAAAHVLGLVDDMRVAAALTAITGAAVEIALELVAVAHPVARVAVLGMGRLGGHEMGYASDADILFVYEPVGEGEAEASDAAHAIAADVRRLLGSPGGDFPMQLDPALRPEGRQGTLVRTVEAYVTYHARWSAVWETQALLRADALAGDPALARRLLEEIDRWRWPVGGLSDADLREVRRVKARVELERVPRGSDPRRNTKLGPGGLADVEWVVQVLQLQHAHDVPGLRTTRTLDALAAALDASLVSSADARVLRDAWLLATRVRNAVTLARGRASDSLPSHPRDLERTARILGYPAAAGGRLVEDYLRTARHARAVVTRLLG